MKRRVMGRTSAWRRARFLDLLREGKSEVAAAQMLGIPIHKVHDWKHRVEGFQERIFAIKNEGRSVKYEERRMK